MSAAPLQLAIECATRVASVAVARGDEILALRQGASDQHHAERLLAEIDAVLRDANVALEQIEAFAVTVGPGAFTSLRIGLATVKGLAFGSARPVAAVSTLAVVAHGAPPEWKRVAAVLDARRGELYAGEFDRAGSLPVPIGDEAVESPAALAARVGPGTRLVGELPAGLAEALAEAGRPDLVPIEEPQPAPRAVALAALAGPILAAGQGTAASALAPRYLRRAEAEEKRLAAGGSLDTPQGLQ